MNNTYINNPYICLLINCTIYLLFYFINNEKFDILILIQENPLLFILILINLFISYNNNNCNISFILLIFILSFILYISNKYKIQKGGEKKPDIEIIEKQDNEEDEIEPEDDEQEEEVEIEDDDEEEEDVETEDDYEVETEDDYEVETEDDYEEEEDDKEGYELYNDFGDL